MGFGFQGSEATKKMIARASFKKKQVPSYFDKEVNHDKIYQEFSDHKKMTPEAFRLFKEKIKKQEQDRVRKLLLVFGVIMIGIVSVLWWFLF